MFAHVKYICDTEKKKKRIFLYSILIGRHFVVDVKTVKNNFKYIISLCVAYIVMHTAHSTCLNYTQKKFVKKSESL